MSTTAAGPGQSAGLPPGHPPAGDWPAPVALGPLAATVTIPGSKSLTNRELILASIADGPSVLTEPLRARDTDLMAAGLRALGVDIHDTDDGHGLVVVPAELHGPADIDAGLAGTVMRFLPPVAALAQGPISFDGDPHARTRPMAQVLGALRALGVQIDDGGRGSMPFRVDGTGHVRGGVVTLDASASSQFISALLLAGARYDRGVDVRHNGKPVPSQPHIDMTVALLRSRGVEVDDSEPDRWQVSPGPIAALDVAIEPDLSNAAPFLAAAVVVGGEVTLTGWPATTTQPGGQLPWLLRAFGAKVSAVDGRLRVVGDGKPVGVDLDLHEVGELTPVVAAIAALAQGRSFLRGVAHLRGHETDRLAALTTELTRIGADATQTEDGLVIDPQPTHGGLMRTYADHRMVHAAAVVGLRTSGITIENVATVSKTMPTFTDVWTELLAGNRT
ncbi:MAG TPA: 3-phosphoshikimate 1-carboxyvinyltransferase [Actinopolymorphaceae bacterium]|jgi:3-phosphoshikimate 1-carboxyvinyltransferase